MKIALVTRRGAPQGGIEQHVLELAEGLRARGHAVHLRVVAGPVDPTYATSFASARALTDAPPDVDVTYAHGVHDEALLRRHVAGPLVVAVHDHSAVCVREHSYLPGSLAPCHRATGVACAALGCAVVRTRGATLPVTLRSPLALRDGLARLGRWATFTTCSRYVAGRLIASGAPRDRVTVVHPNPRPAASAPGGNTPAAAPPRPTGPRRELLVVGQLTRGKGIDLAISALRHLPGARLTVAGDGPQRAELEAAARREADGRVRFLGFVRRGDLEALYDAADLVVVPSRWPEPFGMVGIEAMRRGRPVVGADHGGIPEWLVEPDAGRRFSPGSPRALADAAAEVLSDASWGDRARAHALAEHSHERTLAEAERVLEARLT